MRAAAAEALAAVKGYTSGWGADVVYEVTGHAAVLATLPLVRRFGTLILLGDTGTPSLQALTSDVVTRGVHIVGAHDAHAAGVATDRDPWTSRAMEELFLSYLARQQIRTADLVTHRFRPEDAAEAYGVLTANSSEAVGIMFTWK